MKFLARPAEETRPEEPLIQHLEDVANRARDNVPDSVPEAERLVELAWLCGATHDFGKYTTFFQNRLPPQEKEPPKKEYGHHAFISALFGAFVARRRFPTDIEAQLLVYLAIHRHHGQLVTPEEILPRAKNLRDAPEFHRLDSDSLKKGLRAVNAQMADLRDGGCGDQILGELSGLGLTDEARLFLQQEAWWDLLPVLREGYRDLALPLFGDAPEEPEATRRYWRALLLFSALIDADKHISADSEVTWERPDIPSRLVDEHIKSLRASSRAPDSDSRLDEIRRSVYAESTRAVEDKPLEELHPALLSLTAPTGSGKTLTALGYALRLRERVQRERSRQPRIIYALPFVNIIDQNYDVARQVLSRQPGFAESPSTYLLKHHHLSSRAFGEETDSNDKALLLTESWESEIVVTTFVQIFESLVTNRNRALKKLHNIADSIMILDEIQSIPYEQWGLIGHVLTTLVDDLGCTVLQMTATRPHILPEARTSEILAAPEENFRGLFRTRIMPRPEITSIGELSAFAAELHDSNRSVLTIMNTISSSVELYRALRESIEAAPYREYGRECSGRPLVYLSTNLTPWQRAWRVRMLRRYMRRGGKPLVVSTQVVEAGVDLSFDTVVRDQGPLDSIVQVAGRCNRGGESVEPGPVYVVYLERDDGRSTAELVYGKVLPDLSRRVLSADTSEPQLYGKLDEYFGSLPERLSDDESTKYIAAIRALRFGRGVHVTVSDYRHIKELETEPILVEVNEEARDAITKLENLYMHGGGHHQFREAYREIGPFIITPSKKRVEDNPPAKHQRIPEHRYIPLEEMRAEKSTYYDLEIGFRWDASEEASFF